MHAKFTSLTPELYAYLVAHTSAPDPILRELTEATAALGPASMMQIATEQAAFLTMLARLIGARRAVEVGTFTGTSAIAIARGLTDDGHLTTCELDPERASMAEGWFARAGLAERITVKRGPALDTLRALPATPAIDLAFVDADKQGYRAYYDELLPRLRPNGLLVFDNVLWGGRVATPTDQGESTRALRALNDQLVRDDRVEIVMLPVADGLTLARKR